MKKLFTIFVYTFVILLIGRNMVSLPRFNLFSEADSFTSDLKKQTQEIVSKQKGNYGVYFQDLNNNSNFGINEEMTFTAASVNKVPIVAVLYYLHEQNKVDLDEQITLQENDIQDYGTGSLRYQEPGGVYTLRTLAKLALQQSDNTAAYVLGKKLGSDVVQSTIESWGLSQTDIEENKSSPKDMGLLFTKIYKGEVASDALTKELLGYMKDTDIEDRLPHLMPSDTIVYHKTGDAVGNLHDVGIIQRGETLFFLGVMTSDIGSDEAAAKDTIAKIGQNSLAFYVKRQ